MADDDALLDLDSRRRIYRHIQDTPGLHLRGLQRALDMPLGTLEYHLHQMEKSGLIVSRDDGRFKAFFARDGLDRRDKDILYYVRQEMPRQIVVQLILAPGLTHTQLTERLPISASTCSFHLKKLVNAGIVREERVGRTKRFEVVERERAANVLVTYRRSFLDDLVDRFARAWLDVGGGGIQPQKTDEGEGGGSAPTGTEREEEAGTEETAHGKASGRMDAKSRSLLGGLLLVAWAVRPRPGGAAARGSPHPPGGRRRGSPR